jgi:hypothetical protein
MRVFSLVNTLKVARTRRMASRLRATMRAMENAAAANDLAALHRHTREQVRVLDKLKRESIWPDAQLMAFLADGGIVRSLHDPELEKVVGEKVAEAELRFGQAA